MLDKISDCVSFCIPKRLGPITQNDTKLLTCSCIQTGNGVEELLETPTAT